MSLTRILSPQSVLPVHQEMARVLDSVPCYDTLLQHSHAESSAPKRTFLPSSNLTQVPFHSYRNRTSTPTLKMYNLLRFSYSQHILTSIFNYILLILYFLKKTKIIWALNAPPPENPYIYFYLREIQISKINPHHRREFLLSDREETSFFINGKLLWN